MAIMLLLGLSAAQPALAAAVSQPKLVLQAGHDGAVTATAWSPDGRLLLTGGADLAILVWDVATGHLLSREIMPFDRSRVPHTLSNDQRFSIARIIVSPDGRHFASTIDFDGGEQHETVVWDMATRDILRDVPDAALFWSMDGKRLMMVGSAPRRGAPGNDDRPPVTVAWLPIEGAAPAQALLTLPHMSAAAQSPDGRWALLGCGDSYSCPLTAIDAEGRVLPGPRPDVPTMLDIAWSADGAAWLLDDKRMVHIYRPGSAERRLPLPPLLADDSSGMMLSVSPDGRRIAFSEFAPLQARDPEIGGPVLRLADGVSGVPIGRAEAPYPPLGQKVNFADAAGGSVIADRDYAGPDGKRVLLSGAGRLRIVSPGAPGKALDLAPGASIDLLDVAVSGDGQMVALLKAVHDKTKSEGRDETTGVKLDVWEVEQGRFLPELSVDDTAPIHPSYEHLRWIDGDRLALMGELDLPTAIVDVRSGAILERMPVRDIRPIGSDRYFASEGRNGASWTAISDSFALYDDSSKQVVKRFGDKDDAAGGMRGFAVSPDGGKIAQAGLGYGDWGARWGRLLLWDTASAEKTLLADKIDVGEALTFTADGRQLLAAQGNRLVAWDMETNLELRTIATVPNTILHVAASPQNLVAYASAQESEIGLATLDGRGLPSLAMPASEVRQLGFIGNRPILWAVGSGGVVRFWSTADRRELFTFYPLADRRFIVVAPDGRYETNLPAETSSIGWVMPDDSFRLLAPQTFMRDYFESRLAARLIACAAPTTDCGDFKPLPPLATLNRLRPEVTIDHVALTAAGKAQVQLTAHEISDDAAVNHRIHSGAYDLRLFRDGHLVAEWPTPTQQRALTAWREHSALVKPGAAQSFTQSITIPVPTAAGSVDFSAYAFNDDRVKGDNVHAALTLPAAVPHPRRAFVIAIGIDAYRETSWRLRFAAGDARALASSLGTIADYQIVPVTLLADGDHAQADKADIKALIALLAGHEEARARLKAKGIDVSGIARATPDDAVIITFSGHGDADADHNFFLVPADGRRTGGGAPDRASLISSDELTDWLRGVEAGELALVIDACHSAASVDTGDFKPAPIGDPGLGQLAFDKGIRILAASQGDGVAMESATLRHGLLTYALVEDGLAKGLADLNGDGRITLDELLRYAELRLPELSRPKPEKPRMLAARTILFDGETAPRRYVQKPQLFDFTDTASQLVVRTAAKAK